MIDMKEEILIEQGARLADAKAPENIFTERAGSLVASKLAKKSHSRPALVWGGSAFALAVAAAVVIAVILPSGRRTIHSGAVMEMTSVHASSGQMDTTIVEHPDSLGSIELPAAE